MQEIKIKPDLLYLIDKGLKTATTRLGIKNYTLGPVIFVNSEYPEDKLHGFTINALELREFSRIDEIVSYCEGYTYPALLKRKLEEIYGNIDPRQIMTVAWFSKTVG